jgi:hypothetical protein
MSTTLRNTEGSRFEALRSSRSDEPDRAMAKAARFRASLVGFEMKIAAVEFVEAWHIRRLESEVVGGRAILIGVDRDNEMLVQCPEILIIKGAIGKTERCGCTRIPLGVAGDHVVMPGGELRPARTNVPTVPQRGMVAATDARSKTGEVEARGFGIPRRGETAAPEIDAPVFVAHLLSQRGEEGVDERLAAGRSRPIEKGHRCARRPKIPEEQKIIEIGSIAENDPRIGPAVPLAAQGKIERGEIERTDGAGKFGRNRGVLIYRPVRHCERASNPGNVVESDLFGAWVATEEG